MILEAIVTSMDSAGSVNIAPMGPWVDEALTTFTLKPFHTSRTYRNLKQNPEGVIHVTDDVLLLAQAAIGEDSPGAELVPAERAACLRLKDCCRYWEFRVAKWDEREQRASLSIEVLASRELRPFWGLNRAKHAVLEAAILATRVHLLPRQEMLADLARLRPLVQKTGGPREMEAFELLARYVEAKGGGS